MRLQQRAPEANGRRGQRDAGGRPYVAAFAGVCAVLALLYGADVNDVLAGAAFVGVGVLTVVALVVGPVLHRPPHPLPWRLFAVSCALFMTGAALRPGLVEAQGPVAMLADAFTVPGYLCLLATFVAILRTRRNPDRHAVVDGLIVSLGAGLAMVAQFVLPAASIEGRPVAVSVLAATYPFFDVLLLLLTLNLAFTTAVRSPSFGYVAGAVVCLFVGDIGYAVIGAQGVLVAPHWFDTVYLLAFALLGLAALHPSMRDLATAHPRAPQDWSWHRLAMLGAALGLAAVQPVLDPMSSPTLRVLHAVTVTALFGCLLARAVTAVNAFARTQDILRRQATQDALTGLANRSLVVERVDRALRDLHAPVTLAFLDLDGFKLVNDSWGHGTGDQLLVQVAQRLSEALPDAVAIGRVGGDEFVVAAATSAGTEDRLAIRLTRVFTRPFRLHGVELFVTPSVGLVTGSPGSGTAEGLMRDADTAMYRSKDAGRGRCTRFEPAMHAQVRHRVEMEVALRHAVARGQLRLEYQPIVDLADGSVLSLEALVRWDHPLLGRIAPTDFIPVAEDSGVITDLGAWVLATALDDVASWHGSEAGGGAPSVSVNVSTRQLLDGAFPGLVAAELDRTGLPPGVLTLEVTESAMLDDGGVAARALRELQRLGVRIAVDDFGTGYSALSHLRRLPLDVVKVDRAFVARLGGHAADEAIVRAIVGMAHALDLRVVAEGVETAAQRAALLALGVERGQGWLFGRPAPAPGCRPDTAGVTVVAS